MTTRKRAKPTPPSVELPPVTPELRAAVHALLDKTLDDNQGNDVDAASEPNAMAFKVGMIDTLFFRIHPERGLDIS